MARGDALKAALGGQTGKVESMAEETATADETSTDDSADVTLTPEEITALREERDALREAANKSRTAAAREAKAKADADRKAAKEGEDVEALKAQLRVAEETNLTLLDRVTKTQARTLAKELGAVDPAVVVRLIDFEDMADPMDEDEVSAAVAKILKEKPYLKGGKVKTDAGSGGGGNTAEISMNDRIRSAKRGG